MFCKWCGMESDTEDICSWCGTPLTPTGVAQVEKQKTSATTQEETASTIEDDSTDIASHARSDQTEAGLMSRAVRPLVSSDDTPVIEEIRNTPSDEGKERSKPAPNPLARASDSVTKPPQKRVLPGMPPPPRKSGVVPPPVFKPTPVSATYTSPTPLVSGEPVIKEEPSERKDQTEEQTEPQIAFKPLPLNREMTERETPEGIQDEATKPVETESAVKTWYCRWCGMQSASEDTCSWCHKDLTALPEISSREKQENAPVSSEPKQPSPPARSHPSKDSNARAFIVREETILYRKDLLTRSLQYLGCVATIVVLSILVLRDLPSSYLITMGVANFASCILMPLIGVAPFGEDDSEDFALGLGLFLIMGPLVGGIIYSVIGMIKQSANPGIIGVFLTYLIIRLNLDLFLHKSLQMMLPLQGGVAGYAPQALILAGIAGWYAAGIYHKHDE